MKNKDPLSLIEDLNKRYKDDIIEKSFFGYPMAPLREAEEKLSSSHVPSVAYFSMEYGLAPNIYLGFENAKLVPTKTDYHHDLFSNMRDIDYFVPLEVKRRPDLPIYSGGLGVLAGDTVKSSADLGISMIAIGILWHEGYFKQNLMFRYGQLPEPVEWDPSHFPGLVPLKTRITLPLVGDPIHLKLWKYYVYSQDKSHVVPLVLLDANIPENSPAMRTLTAQLYRSDDARLKILQRVILGIGGIEALKALGTSVDCYHLNEGHAAFAFVEMAKGLSDEEVKSVGAQFVYTCHTPVIAGHDRFDLDLGSQFILAPAMDILRRYALEPQNSSVVNLTQLCISVCSKVNAVSQKHGEVMRVQFPHFAQKIQAITNGVHHATWVSDPIARLLDEFSKHIGPWREDPTCLTALSHAKEGKGFREGLWSAHQENKRALCALFDRWKIREDVLTIAWARRFAGYKRPDMILHDIPRLLEVAKNVGQIQIFLAGKAHPNDKIGFAAVNEILNRIDDLEKHKGLVRVIMLDNYDTYWAKLLASSVDIWLNNPLPPFEASGTSGMKAIANGVLQVSTLDGWVVEAADQGVGKIFGFRPKKGEIGDEQDLHMQEDTRALYDTLEEIGKIYADSRNTNAADPKNQWVNMMIQCLAQSGVFNTHRMVREYQEKIWGLTTIHWVPGT